MLAQITTAISALQAETATYPEGVQLWMKLMGLSFLASVIFIYSRVGARWILAALVLNLLGLVIGKMVFPDASRTAIGTLVHVIFWTPILWAVWRSSRRMSFSRELNSYFGRAYIIWLCWASLVMSISLVLDYRTLVSMWL